MKKDILFDVFWSTTVHGQKISIQKTVSAVSYEKALAKARAFGKTTSPLLSEPTLICIKDDIIK